VLPTSDRRGPPERVEDLRADTSTPPMAEIYHDELLLGLRRAMHEMPGGVPRTLLTFRTPGFPRPDATPAFRR